MRLKKFIKNRDSKDIESSRIPDIIIKDCKLFIKELKKTRKKDFLYRGTEKGIFNFKKIKSRKNREPKDMPDDLHKLFDKLFESEFGWKARSEGVFVTGNPGIAGSYGIPYIFFPIGKYKYVWSSSIEDLFGEIECSEYLYDFEMSDRYDSLNYDYNYIYGPGGEGTFEYDGVDLETNDGHLARCIAIESLGDEELYREYYLEWIPKLSLDEYKERGEFDYNEKRYEFVSNLVDKYTDRNLNNLIGYKNEASFKCNSYYLVGRKYFDILREKIYGA